MHSNGYIPIFRRSWVWTRSKNRASASAVACGRTGVGFRAACFSRRETLKERCLRRLRVAREVERGLGRASSPLVFKSTVWDGVASAVTAARRSGLTFSSPLLLRRLAGLERREVEAGRGGLVGGCGAAVGGSGSQAGRISFMRAGDMTCDKFLSDNSRSRRR